MHHHRPGAVLSQQDEEIDIEQHRPSESYAKPTEREPVSTNPDVVVEFWSNN
jgi:hypothetical protein